MWSLIHINQNLTEDGYWAMRVWMIFIGNDQDFTENNGPHICKDCISNLFISERRPQSCSGNLNGECRIIRGLPDLSIQNWENKNITKQWLQYFIWIEVKFQSLQSNCNLDKNFENNNEKIQLQQNRSADLQQLTQLNFQKHSQHILISQSF